jgi:hypothetical protein
LMTPNPARVRSSAGMSHQEETSIKMGSQMF